MTLKQKTKMRGPQTVIFSEHILQASKVSEWLLTKFPECVCRTYNKDYTFLKNHEPELVIFDFGLSIEKDIEIMRKIKQDYPKVTIVAMTSFGHKLLEKMIEDEKVFLIFPKWQILKRLPEIIETEFKYK